MYDFSHCKVPNQMAAGPPWVAVLGATISMTCYIYVFLQCYFYKTAEFVGHPTSMAVYKYLIEAIFVIQYFVIPFINDPSYYYSDLYFYDWRIQCPVGECCASTTAVAWAFITQFCLLSSELWFAAICRDLQLAYTNPFSSYQENKRYFAIVITVVALCSSFGLVYFARPNQIGVSQQGFMWVPTYRNFYDPLATEIYFAWFYLALVYSVYTIYRYGGGEDMNLAGTVSTRLPIMKKGRRYVLGYCSFWALVTIAEFVYLFATDAIGTSNPQNYSVIGYCLAFRGPYALLIIFFSNYESMTWQKAFPFWYNSVELIGSDSFSGVAEKLAMAPHLNKALRAEILFFTSEGIRVSALENLARKRLASKQRLAAGLTESINTTANHHDRPIISTDTYQFSNGKLGNKQTKPASSNNMATSPHVAIGRTEAEDDNSISDNGEDSVRDLEFLEELEQEEMEKEQSGSRTASKHRSDKSEEALARKESRDILRASYTRESYIFSMSDVSPRRSDNDPKMLASMEEARGSHRGGSSSNIATGERFGRRGSSGLGLALGSMSESEFGANRGSTSFRASLDEGQLSRLSLMEDRQDQAVDGMIDAFIQDHIPNSENKDKDKDGALKNSINNIRSSFGLKGTSSKAGNGPTAMETLSEAWERDSISESFASSRDSGERGIEMRQVRASSQSTNRSVSSEADLSWRDSSATVTAHHDSSGNIGKDHRDTLAHPGRDDNSHISRELSASRMAPPHVIHGTEWRVRQPSSAGTQMISVDAGASLATSSEPASGGAKREQASTGMSRVMQGAEIAKTQLLSLFQQTLYDFEFIDYCPRLFSLVRRLCGISETEYAAAFESVTGEDFSEGRSGSFTFFSKNGEFFVKAQTLGEIQSLREMLPSYVRYLSKNRSSLLIKFLGAHQIKMYGKELYFVIMCNVFPKDVVIHERWDLKGSWVKRHGNAGVFVTGRGEVMKKESPLYFDNDIHHGIELHPAAANAIFRQLKQDANFLANQGLMDYSLLVGVVKARMEVLDNVVPGEYSEELLRNLTRDNPFLMDSSGGLRPICVQGASTYYVGMIDVLQRWNLKKKSEHFFKTLVLCWDKEGISAVNPQKYCKRFVNRVMRKLFVGVNDDEQMGRMAEKSDGVTSTLIDSIASVSVNRSDHPLSNRFVLDKELDAVPMPGEVSESMSPFHESKSGNGGMRLKADLYPVKSARQSMSATQRGISVSVSASPATVATDNRLNGGSISKVRVTNAQSQSSSVKRTTSATESRGSYPSFGASSSSQVTSDSSIVTATGASTTSTPLSPGIMQENLSITSTSQRVSKGSVNGSNE